MLSLRISALDSEKSDVKMSFFDNFTTFVSIFVLPPQLISSKISTLFNSCELIRPDLSLPDKNILKINPQIKYVHEELFYIELDEKELKLLETIKFRNAQDSKNLLNFNKTCISRDSAVVPFVFRHFYISIFTPISAPRIFNEPVLLTIFISITGR